MITVTKPDLPPIEKYIEYLKKIWASRWLTNNGEFVQLLEKKLEEYLRVKNLVLVANGTLGMATYALIIILACGASYFLVSLFTSPPPKETLDRVFASSK